MNNTVSRLCDIYGWNNDFSLENRAKLRSWAQEFKQNPNQEKIERIAKGQIAPLLGLSTKSYSKRFRPVVCYKKGCLNHIFRSCLKSSLKETANVIDALPQSYFSKFKKIIVIKIPEFTHDLLSHPVVKIAVIFIVVLVIPLFIKNRVERFITDTLFNRSPEVIEKIEENQVYIIGACIGVGIELVNSGTELYQSVCEKINSFVIRKKQERATKIWNAYLKSL